MVPGLPSLWSILRARSRPKAKRLFKWLAVIAIVGVFFWGRSHGDLGWVLGCFYYAIALSALLANVLTMLAELPGAGAEIRQFKEQWKKSEGERTENLGLAMEWQQLKAKRDELASRKAAIQHARDKAEEAILKARAKEQEPLLEAAAEELGAAEERDDLNATYAIYKKVAHCVEISDWIEPSFRMLILACAGHKDRYQDGVRIEEMYSCYGTEDEIERDCVVSIFYATHGKIGYASEHLRPWLSSRKSDVQPHKASIEYHYGACFEFVHRYKDALEYFRKAEKRSPGFQDTQERIEALEQRLRSKGHAKEERKSDDEPAKNHGTADPYSVLGIERGADEATIKAAYRKLIVQYHPDKVASLGDELKALAEKKSKQITVAYNECLKNCKTGKAA